MKTNLFQLNLAAAMIVMTTGLSAQTSSSKKTCIKINEIIDGKERHIDTCFIGKSEADINQTLKDLGFSEVKDTDIASDMKNIDINVAGDDKDGSKSKVIMINTDKDGEDGDDNVKVTSTKGGTCSTVVVKGGKTYA